MEAVQRRPSGGPMALLATRKGAWVAAAVSAALAGVALLVYLNQYKNDVSSGLASTPVLTADRLIPKGTAGNLVITERLFKPGAVAQEDVKAGAVADADAIRGKAATRDILPGQQITAADFTAAADPLRSRLAKTDRLVQLPLDGPHGMLGTIRAGDRVDVMASFNGQGGRAGGGGRPTVRYLMRDVRVASAPAVGANGGSVILEASDRQAAQLAYVSDNAKMWFVLRPPVGATDGKAPTVSAEALQGSRTVEVTANVKETEDGGTVTIRAKENER